MYHSQVTTVIDPYLQLPLVIYWICIKLFVSYILNQCLKFELNVAGIFIRKAHFLIIFHQR